MAGRIRRDDVDAVRERSDIVKVVSGYLQLKKTGRDSFTGLCPFHAEKTGSFTVSPSKQVFYCFGCGEGGDVFRFMEKVESLSFTETVERLADQAGVRLRYEGENSTDRKVAGHRQALFRANAEAGALYQRMLLDGPEAAGARDYLASRGITAQSVERFGVGSAPGQPDFLLRRLAKSVSPQLLVEAGLVQDVGGALKDRFRGRVTFPIHDLSGNPVGFGGRLLQPKDRPPVEAAKYVNSSDSPVYHKGSLLYNLHRAKAEVTRAGRVFLVEGYTDVVALDQAGVTEVVATCGTALGEDHVRQLSRFTDRLVLAFDSDEAGARAAERAFQFHEQYAVDFAVLILPEGQDPADFAAARGDEAGAAFRELTDRAVPLVEYMIRRTMAGRDLANPEDRSRAVTEGLGIVVRLENPVRRQEYAPLVADLAGVNVGSVMLELQRATGPAASRFARSAPRNAAGPSALTRRPPHEQVEREAMKLLIQSPDVRRARLATLDPERFTVPSMRKAFEFLRESPGGAGADVAILVAAAGERSEALGRLVSSLALEPLHTVGDPSSGYVDSVVLRLEDLSLEREIKELKRELERLNPLTAQEEHRRLFDRFAELLGHQRRVREAAEAADAVGSAL